MSKITKNITLYTSASFATSERRSMEIQRCIKNNAKNCYIKDVVVVTEDVGILPDLPCVYVKVNRRPTISDIIIIANSRTGSMDDLFIISNADIEYDDSLCYVGKLRRNQCYSLTRWERTDNTWSHFGKYYSNDSWIFRGKIPILEAPWHLGQWGCDTRFNKSLYQSGYKLINPSLTIRTYHHHDDVERDYFGKTADVHEVYFVYPRLLQSRVFTAIKCLLGDEQSRIDMLFVKKKYVRLIKQHLMKYALSNCFHRLS